MNTDKPRRFNKKGFTLVELMIVVVIMAVLVAVAVPVYVTVAETAKKRTCNNNCRTISSAVTNYLNGAYSEGNERQTVNDFEIHNENSLPKFYDIGGGTPSQEILDFSVWLLSQYRDPQSLCCGNGGIITVNIVTRGEAIYADVVCSLHDKAD